MSTSDVDSRQEAFPAQRYPAENFITYFKWYLLQAGLVALVAAYVFLQARLHPRSSERWILGISLAIAGSGLILYVAYRQLRRTRWVELSPTALTWQDSSGLHECPLGNIRDVYRSETVTTYNHMWAHHQLKVKVTMIEGRTLDLDLGIAGIDELCDRLQQIAAANRSGGGDGETAESGESFGPLTIFPDGLLMKGRKYPWNDIRSYQIENGYLRINPYMKKGCQPAEFALSKIPNYSYLLELMEARSGRNLMET